MLFTARMRLIPATAELARADLEDSRRLSTLLGATVPRSWPPEMVSQARPWFARELASNPTRSGWYAWYGVIEGQGASRSVLAVSAGFVGAPRVGTVELGYSVVPEYRRLGYASEMVRAIIKWAFEAPDLRRIVAEVHKDNDASIRLLLRMGFTDIGPSQAAKHIRFELLDPRGRAG